MYPPKREHPTTAPTAPAPIDMNEFAQDELAAIGIITDAEGTVIADYPVGEAQTMPPQCICTQCGDSFPESELIDIDGIDPEDREYPEMASPCCFSDYKEA